MVETGVTAKLLEVLKTHSTAEGDLRLQHAVLSALRNLSIAKQNKPIIIEQVRCYLLITCSIWELPFFSIHTRS